MSDDIVAARLRQALERLSNSAAAPELPPIAARKPVSAAIEERRRRDRDRQRLTRARRRVRRAGGAVVELHVSWGTLRSLELLGLLPAESERRAGQVEEALAGFLSAAAPPLADMARRFAAL